jgi:hypothetical protein
MQPRLASTLRYQYADEVEGLIQPRILERDKREIFTAAQEWRIPFAPVLGIDELMGDPQYEARGFFHEIGHPQAGTITYPGAPFRMSETPAEVRRAPLLGEHNDEVYIEALGLSQNHLILIAEIYNWIPIRRLTVGDPTWRGRSLEPILNKCVPAITVKFFAPLHQYLRIMVPSN